VLEPLHGLVNVQARIFVPVARPKIVVVGLKTFVIVPLPEENDHVPTPTGVVAFIVTLGVLAQTVWLVPAFGIPATPATMICTVAMLLAQTPPLLMVHCSIFTPRFNVAVVFAAFTLAIVPLPCANDQVPTSGKFGSIVTVELAEMDVTEDVTQSVWFGVLIEAVVGAGFT